MVANALFESVAYSILIFERSEMQTKQILDKIVKRFRPFVITTSDGYSVSIQRVNHLLVGKDSIVIMDSEGLFEFIPIEQVTRISTKEGDVLMETTS